MKFIISILLITVTLSTATKAQTTTQQIIEQRIKSGAETATVAADEIVLASQNVMPRYYEARNFEPSWTDKNNFSALISVIEDAYNEGLNPYDYHLERIVELIGEVNGNQDPKKLADLDMLMTDAIFLYGAHLIMGKVDQSKIRSGWEVPPNQLPENGDSLLSTALAQRDLSQTIDKLKPNNFMYEGMRNGLKNLRTIATNGGWPEIPPGQVLKPGVNDSRVAILRKYLSITGDLDRNAESEDDNIFDETVEAAVKQFQFRHNLNQDGVIGKGTLETMNIPVEERINTVRVNMERARWVMHRLPKDFMVVNIAGYNVRRVTNDSVVFWSRVIVGRHYHETPIFKGTLRYIELNPTWTLPYSIATKETLPKLKKDPTYLAKKNMIIMDRSGKELDPSTIDFNSLSRGNFPYTLRQKAGPHNALGQVKFMFPNKHAVYLHDTPARSLFAREDRAFSHGCIRLDKKWELFLNLVGDDGWDMKRINEVLNSGKTTRVSLKHPIEILLLYWTAGGDKQNRLYFNKDIYDRDASVLKELNKRVVFSDVQ